MDNRSRRRDGWKENFSCPRKAAWRPEQKLELMMTDLDQEKMEVFHQAVSRDGPDARKVKPACLPLLPHTSTQRSGIDQLLPGMVMDDFLFPPFGYSMNGIMEAVILHNHLVVSYTFLLLLNTLVSSYAIPHFMTTMFLTPPASSLTSPRTPREIQGPST